MLVSTEQNFLLWVIGLSIIAILMVAVLTFVNPSDMYLKAGDVAFFKLPRGAYDVSVQAHLQSKLEQLYKQGNLLYFVGETEIIGSDSGKSIARLKAFQQFAEFLDLKVLVFKRLVEGQVTLYASRDVLKDDLVSAIEETYLAITQLVATARISGVVEYASWKYKKNSREVLAVLVFLDYEALYAALEKDPALGKNLSTFKEVGVEFRKLLSATLFDKSLDSNVVASTSRSDEVLTAVGQGSDASKEKAEDAARKDALRKLAEQVYVTVETETKLWEHFRVSVSSTGGPYEEELKAEYDKIIKVVSKAGLYGVKYTVLETRSERGVYTVFVRAEISRSTAIQDFAAQVIASAVQSLISRKMLFTCHTFLQSIDLKSFERSLPSTQQMFVQIGIFDSIWRRVSEIRDKVFGKSIRTLEDALEVGNLLSELETVSTDYPDTFSIVKRSVEQWAGKLRPTVIAQRHVWMGEKVKLKLKYNSIDTLNRSELKLKVVGKNCKPDRELVTVRFGEGSLWVSLEGESPEVEFRYGGTTILTWRPERVFKTDSQVDTDRISSVSVILLTLASGRESEFERDLSRSCISLLKELLKLELDQSSSLEITVFDSSSIETLLGNLNSNNFDTLLRTFREQRLAKYLVVPMFSFITERFGNLQLLRLSVNFRVADLMTSENWTVTLYAEGLGLSTEEALKNILTTPEFRSDFSKRVVHLLKF